MSRATIKGGASALPGYLPDWAVAASLVALVALAGSSVIVAAGERPAIDRTLTECVTDSECEALDADTVLIGLGCGPDKVTSYAAEEDEFRFDHCDVIEARRVVGVWAVEGSR